MHKQDAQRDILEETFDTDKAPENPMSTGIGPGNQVKIRAEKFHGMSHVMFATRLECKHHM